ncbi:MAG: hypothetical protein ACFB2W_09610 [Leptolyngbyaceae cyanobacterium]
MQFLISRQVRPQANLMEGISVGIQYIETIKKWGIADLGNGSGHRAGYSLNPRSQAALYGRGGSRAM